MRLPVATTVVALLCGCKGTGVSGIDSDLLLGAERVEFPGTVVGRPVHALLTLRNAGAAATHANLSTESPFGVEPAQVDVPGGATVTLRLQFSAARVGGFEGMLEVENEGAVLTASLAAVAAEIPECLPSGPCKTAAFDLGAGMCFETPLAEGTVCDGALCQLDATCHSGECVGRARDCEDDDLCSTDVCEPTIGCLHLPATARCPASSDPCRVPACDPAVGCTFADAVDGTPCGPADCSTADVCITGACKRFPLSDGAACGEASPCQPRGRCMANACVRAAATDLPAAWTVWAAPGYAVHWDSIADPQGNVYWREVLLDGGLPPQLVSASHAGLMRFSVPVPPAGRMAFIEDRLVIVVGPTVEARSASDGALLWTMGLPVTEPGIIALSARTVARGPSGVVYVTFNKMSDQMPGPVHGSVLTALDIKTGGVLWRVDLPGVGVAEPATPVDEAGMVYVGVAAETGKAMFISVNAAGHVRWAFEHPHGHPAAVFGGRVYHWDHWLSETANGSWVNDMPPMLAPAGYPRLALGAVSYMGTTMVDGEMCSMPGTAAMVGAMQLTRVNPPTSTVQWTLTVGAPDAGGMTMTNSILTSRSTVLFSQSEEYCEASQRHVLREVSALGAPGFQCRLPGPEAYAGEGLLSRGRWIVQVNSPDGGTGVRAIDLPGFELPEHGWATAWGSPARDGRAP